MGIIGELVLALLGGIVEGAIEDAIGSSSPKGRSASNIRLPKGRSAANLRFPAQGNEKSIAPPDSDAVVRNHMEDYQARSERMLGRGSLMMK